MNTIKEANSIILNQLVQVLEGLPDDGYGQALELLQGSSIGQHVRHTIEFYECFFEGIESGIISYDNRKRDFRTELDTAYSCQLLNRYIEQVATLAQDQKLQFNCMFSENKIEEVPTTLSRELAYLVEHTIHHLAIIKMALQQIYPNIDLPTNFGVAFSTVRFHNH